MRELYPADATDAKIEMAINAAWQNYEESRETTPECNLTPDCGPDMWFNPLTCGCYEEPSLIDCEPLCREGQYVDPSNPCQCIDEYDLYRIYPSWADLDDILTVIGPF